MKCPHCLVQIQAPEHVTFLGKDVEGDWAIEWYTCPNEECAKLILYLVKGVVLSGATLGAGLILEAHERRLIRPVSSGRPPAPSQVPDGIAEDYTEACLVLPYSAKASAALSRRCLQGLLREAAGVTPGNLADEIQQVISSGQLPARLVGVIDAVRNIGNFAAHPTKSLVTGEVVPIEVGEAEWNLDVLELLFDFYFVQPEVIKKKKLALDAKLAEAGKPPLK